jgi:hypothetical protein
MNLDDYTIEVTMTPKDIEFTKQATDAGIPLLLVSMYRTALEKLVAAEREECAKICEALDDGSYAGGDQPYGQHYAAAIRTRGQK